MDKAKKKKETQQESNNPVIVHGFKGFDKDLRCRDKQYAFGETFEELEASLCNYGLHFCEHPLDCLGYYFPGDGSRYATVIADSPDEERSSDTKRVTKKMSIGVELTLKGLVDAAVKFVFDCAEWRESDKTTGDSGAASATGHRGAASATGHRGAASATGHRGAASATGKESVAMSSGRKGKAKACLGSWIVIAERNDDWEIVTMRCAKIDGEILKPDTYYILQDGEFVEA